MEFSLLGMAGLLTRFRGNGRMISVASGVYGESVVGC
jgi:hypothetical protein